jgi:hypothetical protein
LIAKSARRSGESLCRLPDQDRSAFDRHSWYHSRQSGEAIWEIPDQFKGAHIASNASTEKEIAIQDIYMEKLIARLTQIGIGVEHLKAMALYPSTAVTFSVQDVFVQTPGPGAGARYDFTPGA